MGLNRRALLVAGALSAASLAQAQGNPPVTVSVDAAANRRTISPLIYGVHFTLPADLLDLNATINRLGGNSVGRYNYLQNIDNRGGDYFFESIPYADDIGGLGDDFIADTKAGGAEPYLSMPMVGWVAKTNPARQTLCSFSVAKYGAQTASDEDCGNGCVAAAFDEYPCQTGRPRRPPDYPAADPNDASVPAGAAFQQGWMQHVKDTWGPASGGGLRFWGLDNEPTIWHQVYWDVHPAPADTTEIRDKMIDYASRIKSVDATAQVLGPQEWGWDGYFYSGKDQDLIGRGLCDGLDCPDRTLVQGGLDYSAYLLDRMRQYEIDNGQRILDVFTQHFYPQSGEFSDGGNVDPAMQDLRNRSTRDLWDPDYPNEAWIPEAVRLIPRMRAWVDTYYPGTKIGLAEYDWGADNHINGATTQADLLGIFGREGLDLALRWNTMPANSPVYNAFKMYRNYDGSKSAFGDTSVSAAVPNPDNVSAFAAERGSDGALTIMVVSKQRLSGATATVNLANFAASGTVEMWQLTLANTITHVEDFAYAGGTFNRVLPAQSITLFVVRGSGGGTTADLAITKTDGETTAFPLQVLTYTIDVTNNGPSAAIGATVVDNLPPGLVLANWTCAGAGGGTCTASGAGNINDTVTLPVGGSVTYTLVATVNFNPGHLRNTATVSVPAGTTDPAPANNTATDEDIPVCFLETVVVPDGRLTAKALAGNSMEWFAASLTIGNSYSLELKSRSGDSTPPGALDVYSGDDACSLTSTVTTRDTTAVDPGSGASSRRMSFTAAGAGTFFRAALDNTLGLPIAFSFSWSDTTMFSPAWGTNGGFDTFYSFQNTTGAALDGRLTLFDTSGTVLSTEALSIPAGQTASTNTSSMGVPRNRAGTARFTHDGPPGAVVAEAAVANFSLSPAYVQPVKFQAVRETK